MNDNTAVADGEIIRGAQAKRAATHMDIGNIVALLLPVPLALLWFGLSILVYAMHRHHPNPKVGHYTQWAAYRFYGVVGALVPVATFFPGSSVKLWLATWAIAAAIIIPSSIWALIKIRNDHWEDTVLPKAATETAPHD